VAEHPSIDVQERRRVARLHSNGDRCIAVALDDGRLIAAGATVLATGGAAALWSRTTNPPGATGGGLLLALDVGATLADLEFMQFHPTAVVARGEADGLLVTEAVRGEGARLLDARGERFVDELAPRDEVARAIQRQMAHTDSASVALDMRDVDPALFPNVVTALRAAGIDPERELVPVAPAAHYMMGGVATDSWARTSIAGLYAVGECSCTGLHGANRLASNSLTECFVFGARAAQAVMDEPSLLPRLGYEESGAAPPRSPCSSSRQALWQHGGLLRDACGLRKLLDDPHPLVRLIAECALAREESRGAHTRHDFQAPDPAFDGMHTIVRSQRSPQLEPWG
jgi:L-aspartate oxidase